MGQELTTRTKTNLPASCKPILDTLVMRGRDFDRWTTGELPVITEETKIAAKQALAVISENLTPANPEGTKAAIFALLQHYYVSDLPPQVHQAIATDWIHCLADYPAWSIEQARIDWMKNNRRKPTPGEIVNLCDKAISKDRAMKKQCKNIIAVPLTPKPEPEMTPQEHAESIKRVREMVKKIKAICSNAVRRIT